MCRWGFGIPDKWEENGSHCTGPQFCRACALRITCAFVYTFINIACDWVTYIYWILRVNINFFKYLWYIPLQLGAYASTQALWICCYFCCSNSLLCFRCTKIYHSPLSLIYSRFFFVIFTFEISLFNLSKN